jgi:5-formyltetrahydrofolate cyclo-ligase
MVTSKDEIRLRIRANRDLVPASWRQLMARAATNRALPYFQGHETIAVYNAIRSELDPILLIEALRARGATLVYPRVAADSSVLEFCKVNVADQFQPGPFGLLEPSSNAELVPVADINAFAIPGLSFDRKGNRLGWGKGHYDQTLAQNTHALRVGLCFQEQIEPSLPNDTNDQSMDWVVTDAMAFQGSDRGATADPRDALPKEST